MDPSVFDKQKLVEFYGALDDQHVTQRGITTHSWHRPGGNRVHTILPLSNSKLFDGKYFSNYDVTLTDKEIFPILCDLILCFYLGSFSFQY